MPPSHAQLERVMAGDDRSIAAHATRVAMRLGQPFYWLGLQLDQRRKAARAQPLPRPTVSVGNLTAGGTGKTPLTVELVRRLRDQRHRPAVLMRGYQPASASVLQHAGAPDRGMVDPLAPPDETEMLRAALGDDTPVEPNASRLDGAAAVLARHPAVTCFILDDGFQHRQVRRDLDLVLIDATRPFGHGHLLPRGLLREPLSALRRADAAIVTRADLIPPEQLEQLYRTIAQHHGRPPLAHATHHWAALRRGDDTTALPVEHLAELNVHGVCAIGNPDAFRRQIEQHAAAVVGFDAFDDHHAYTPPDVERILQEAHATGADAIVLTEKDWPKWRRAAVGATPPDTAFPVYRPVLAMRFTRGNDALTALLRERLPFGR